MGIRLSSFDNGLIQNDSGNIVGISLGYSFCAEHEHGVADMISDFGMSNEHTGINRLKIHTCNPENFLFYVEKTESNSRAILFYTSKSYYAISNQYKSIDSFSRLDSILRQTSDTANNFNTAWCNSGFCIYTDKEENVDFLQRLYEAFKRCDILVGFSTRKNVFRNNCLQFLILSAMSDKDLAALK